MLVHDNGEGKLVTFVNMFMLQINTVTMHIYELFSFQLLAGAHLQDQETWPHSHGRVVGGVVAVLDQEEGRVGRGGGRGRLRGRGNGGGRRHGTVGEGARKK